MKAHKTPFHSLSNATLPKGCRLCVKGRKTVIFITGICPRSCFYCPISEQKYKKDVVYINEWPTKKSRDLLKEIWLCDSKGAGITGGDPLARLDRTVRYIKLMKKRFGKKFHIHLYTPLDLVNEKSLARLFNAGLDEIRFHPDLADDKLWHRISLAGQFGWDIGVEIPVIPGYEKQTLKLIAYIKAKVDFLNLNELEISDTNAQHLLEKGFKPKDRLSYGVKGSEELAKRLLRYCTKLKIRTHYCTAKLKDSVQLANRLKLRAKRAKKPYDLVTGEGMLVRAALYYIGNPLPAKRRLLRLGISEVGIDMERRRLLFSAEDAFDKYIALSGMKVMIVEEYPTHDSMTVQALPLAKDEKSL